MRRRSCCIRQLRACWREGKRLIAWLRRVTGLALSRKCSTVSNLLISLDTIHEHCPDIACHRTGKAAKFLLYNHVILPTTHSIRERAVFKPMFFRNLAASSLANEMRCRFNPARSVHDSTFKAVANTWVPIPDAWSHKMRHQFPTTEKIKHLYPLRFSVSMARSNYIQSKSLQTATMNMFRCIGSHCNITPVLW